MEGLYLHNLVFKALCADTNTIALYILLGWGEQDFVQDYEIFRILSDCILFKFNFVK